MPLQTPAAGMPRQLFFTTPAQRTALARQQFFEEGQRPSGLVDEAVIQSWMRCNRAHARPRDAITFDPVTPSRLHSALARNWQLLQASGQDLASMETSLAGTECRVLLTDGDGVIVHATHSPLAAQPLLRKAARIGVNIAENRVGTTAPGVVAKTGQACTVTGAEHYYDCLHTFQCAAAPIRDVHGRLAAVLDLSIESRSFGFDAAAMVGLYATSIENRLLQTQSREHLVLHFQANPALLGTPLEALAGITPNGQLAWLNSVGTRLMGPLPEAGGRDVEALFGLGLAELLRLIRSEAAQPARLSSGLGVWLQARLQARDGVDFRHALSLLAPAEPPPLAPSPAAALPSAADKPEATLGDHSRKFIETTLLDCNGNISKAARKLQVSRGMLYRRLQSWRRESAE
jgi:transcriptional regulator of acetoin/glycerol metabolism